MRSRSYVGSGRKNGRKHTALQVCKILASPTRYDILSALIAARRAKKELCVNEIAELIGVSQSATSHQLALLEAYGVVEGEKMGQTTCYRLTDSGRMEGIEKVVRVFQNI